MKTPLHSMAALFRFGWAEGRLTGTAESLDETVPLHDITVEDTAARRDVTWRQSITRLVRLNLVFDVMVRGDTFTGHSGADASHAAR